MKRASSAHAASEAESEPKTPKEEPKKLGKRGLKKANLKLKEVKAYVATLQAEVEAGKKA